MDSGLGWPIHECGPFLLLTSACFFCLVKVTSCWPATQWSLSALLVTGTSCRAVSTALVLIHTLSVYSGGTVGGSPSFSLSFRRSLLLVLLSFRLLWDLCIIGNPNKEALLFQHRLVIAVWVCRPGLCWVSDSIDHSTGAGVVSMTSQPQRRMFQKISWWGTLYEHLIWRILDFEAQLAHCILAKKVEWYHYKENVPDPNTRIHWYIMLHWMNRIQIQRYLPQSLFIKHSSYAMSFPYVHYFLLSSKFIRGGLSDFFL